ncbi:radical SAM protein [archaeon]|jgi:uncharacterized protein|nr:radical SAM protein [archaeon]MBT6698438.1 radical SAM protein [archaeon]
MAKLRFETLQFREENKDDSSSPASITIILLKIFKFSILLKDLQAIGPVNIIDKHTIEFVDTFEHKARKKFTGLLEGHYSNMTNIISKQQATYVHANSNIPLIGNVAFGIVYRDYSIIELKPITSCNLSCVYCSVKEGKNSQKTDVVVQMEYLLDELDKLLVFINKDKADKKIEEKQVEIHIGVQGEPFLYQDMVLLIEELQKNPLIHTISMDSNYTLVTKQMIDRLEKCTKLRINISLDAMDKQKAKDIANAQNYNLDYVLDLIRYTAKSKLNYLIAPVFTPTYNDDELAKIIEFVKTLPTNTSATPNAPSNSVPTLGIQNYLPYKAGRRPIKKPMPWDKFYDMLKKLEDEHKVKLILNKHDFNIKPTTPLPKPFKVGDQVTGISVMSDRFPNTTLIRAKGRTISVPDTPFKKGKKIKVEITRDKHNIFTGKRL